jgi:hypothetical protein
VKYGVDEKDQAAVPSCVAVATVQTGALCNKSALLCLCGEKCVMRRFTVCAAHHM